MGFEYNEVKMPDDCIFKISPSGIGKFFSYPSVWYNEFVKGEEGFVGSTASELGTVCHAIYESYSLNEELTDEDVEEYLFEIQNGKYDDKGKLIKEPNPEVDIDEVRNNYRAISDLVIEEYLQHNLPDKVEEEVVAEVCDKVYIGGTYDNLTGDTVVDFKTVGKKPSDSIPFNYKIQLLAYAYALKRNGHQINRIRIVYGVKPLKSTPARVFVVTEVITDEDWKLIKDTLTMIAKTVILAEEQPDTVPLLFKSMNIEPKKSERRSNSGTKKKSGRKRIAKRRG